MDELDRTSATEAPPYAAFIKLTGRLCLVIGGGEVAAGKARSLLAAGARVRVVARDVSPAVRTLREVGRPPVSLEILERPFQDEDLEGAFLVIAATDDPALQERIHEMAVERSLLVNVVDVPERCSFYAPSVVQRGNLQIAVSTNGDSPLLSQCARKHLESIFSPRWETYLEWLSEARREVHARKEMPFSERVRVLRELINQETLSLLLAGEESAFQKRMKQWSNLLKD